MELDDEEHEEDKNREMESQKRGSLKENKQLLRMADESTINATSITGQKKTTFFKPLLKGKKERIWSINYPQTPVSIHPSIPIMKEATGLSWAMLYQT